MTMWRKRVRHENLVDVAEVVLEGRIVYAYRDVIPGVSPPVVGIHWLMHPERHAVRVNKELSSALAAFPDIGFWTHES